MVMQNISEMALNYEWTFIDELIQRESLGVSLNESQLSPTKKKGSNTRNTYKINEIFDILPMNGILNPGETEQVEFMYNAILNQKIKTAAICSVEGGPQYEVLIVGDSSLMTYKLSPNLLDFGNLPFNDWDTRDILIENTGKVAYEFNTNITTLMRKGLIEIYPMSGKINGGDKQKLVIRLCPGIPDLIDEQFAIEIAHFEPEIIRIKGNGIYPAAVLQLPRLEDEILKEDVMNTIESKLHNYSHDNIRLQIDRPPTEHEIDNDRKTFCDMLLKSIVPQVNGSVEQNAFEIEDIRKSMNGGANDGISNIFQKLAKNTSSNSKHLDPKCYDKLVLVSYQLDFGNIVIGGNKKKQFKLINVSSIPISLNFDYKTIKTMGITLSHEKSKTINIIIIILK